MIDWLHGLSDAPRLDLYGDPRHGGAATPFLTTYIDPTILAEFPEAFEALIRHVNRPPWWANVDRPHQRLPVRESIRRLLGGGPRRDVALCTCLETLRADLTRAGKHLIEPLHAKGMSLALMGRGREGVEILSEARRGLVEGDFLAALFGLDIPLGAAMVLAGDMAAGIRWIEASMRRFSEWGDRREPAWGHLILGEIYLMMALGGENPPPRVILKNLGFLLRTLPFAARKARRHLEEAIRRTREPGHPGTLAHGLLDLGLLCKAQKRPAEARRHFEEALQIAEPHSAVLTEKIRRALASVAAPSARA